MPQVNRLRGVDQALTTATALSQQRFAEASQAKASLEEALKEKQELKIQLEMSVRGMSGSKGVEEQKTKDDNAAELKRVSQALEEALGQVWDVSSSLTFVMRCNANDNNVIYRYIL